MSRLAREGVEAEMGFLIAWQSTMALPNSNLPGARAGLLERASSPRRAYKKAFNRVAGGQRMS